ncbi:hypothetical protein MNBD_GAMMA02-557 [hydrothermal vent metagenome]|uniref:Periplasmic chaperone PpiD n=1 Tax=hydrothermal vent metagenome TaxID=652676 RepID=A0A3B0VUF7_9ZZZZ
MLTWIRNKSTGLFMTIVMILLIAAFALWGVGDYISQSGNDSLATVNGVTISNTEYVNQFASYRQNMISQFGEGFDPSYFDSPILRRNYLESMINSELVRQVAIDNGFTVTAEEIRQTLEEAPAFKDENGQFDKTLYAAFLSQTNQSAIMLQMKIAQEQAGQALNGIFDQSSFVTPFEAKQMALLNKQTRDIEYLTISPDKFIEGVEVTDAEIDSYYNDNSAQYMTEEMVSVMYIELKAEDVAGSIEIAEADALEYYESNRSAYGLPEQRKTAHILVNEGDDAEQLLQEIQDKLAAGEDFAELSKTYSQDLGSASSGGDLGWVSPDDMVEEFNDTLFAMDVNTVSEPVKTQFGYHIIQLNEIKESNAPIYEAVKADIIQALQAKEAETLFLDKVSALAEESLDAQSGLEQVAESNGYELKTTEFFPRTGGLDLAANQGFIQAAYSENVKENLLNSDIINISDTHVVFLHLNEVKTADLKPLSDVKESIVTALSNLKANEVAKTLADSVVESVNSADQDLATAAVTNELELLTADAVARTGSSLPFNLAKSVFELSRPTDGADAVHLLEGNGADLVVLKLLAVNVADLEAIEDISVESVQLSRNIKSNEQQLLIKALRQAADVTINEDLLNQANNL